MEKSNLFKRTFAGIALVMFSLATQAEITLPAIFGDHMVLQQQTDAALWGKATPGSSVKVTVSWDNKSYSTRAAADGNWKLTVRTPVAGGPYSVTLSDGKALRLNNVLIGEVWVCSGQSNMQMQMKGFYNQPVIGANEAIALAGKERIRLFTVANNKSRTRLDDFSGTWSEPQPENVANFSATAWFFGQMLHEALGVPVGLICSAWGGTRIEPWISENGLKKFNWVTLPKETDTGDFNQQTPTVLFNAMINPMKNFAIRGAIWYQGESNRNEPERYVELMPALVSNWRSEWGIADLPFFYVQIAPYDYGITGLNSAYLREAQLKASNALPNMGMACIMDAGEKDCIHPANKKAAGQRLALLALDKTYGKKGFASAGPVLKNMTIEGSVVKLTFDNAPNGLTTFGKEPENFRIAGENKRFFPAKAHFTRDGITLYAPQVEKPVAVRYAFDDFVVGDLYNIEGIPASSFRTDNWEK